MVPSGLSAGRLRRLAVFAALILPGACARRGERASEGEATDAAGAAALRVRRTYASADAVAAGAWTWAAPGGPVFVAVDVESTVPGLVQGRLDLWATTDSTSQLLGRSDAMSAAAEFRAWAFEDLTGDGIPDFFGAVADSAGVAYPVFFSGARGSLGEQIAVAAPGWRFDTEEPNAPSVISGPSRACALRLWAESPAPDGREAGWRFLALLPGGGVAAPAAERPSCT